LDISSETVERALECVLRRGVHHTRLFTVNLLSF
jgi:hypothetical protein